MPMQAPGRERASSSRRSRGSSRDSCGSALSMLEVDRDAVQSAARYGRCLLEKAFMNTARHLVRVIVALWLGAMLYIALRYLSGLLTVRDFRLDFLASARDITIYFWAPWIVAAPAVAMLARRRPIRPDEWIGPLCVNVLLWLAIALLHGIGASYFYYYFGTMTADMATYAPWQHAGHFLFGDDMLLLDAIAYTVLAAGLNMGKFHEILRQKELDAARLGENLAEL